MKAYKIKKGKHRAIPLQVGLWLNKTVIRKMVQFDFSCKYNLAGDDQDDHNKLFGIGYLWSHHKHSARFGWRFDPVKDKIIISAYCYVNGDRIMKDICEVVAARLYILELHVYRHSYDLFVIQPGPMIELGRAVIDKSHSKKVSFPLGPFFGGNKRAPHDMTIKMKNHVRK